MSEVDPNHAARLQAHHQVVQMPVSDAQDPVADAQECVGAGKVAAESQEGLGAGAHLQEGPPAGAQSCGLCPHPQPPAPVSKVGNTLTLGDQPALDSLFL